MIENFSKLRNIILTTSEEFIEYVVTQQVSPYVNEEFRQMYHVLSDSTLDEDERRLREIQASNAPSENSRSVVLPNKCRNKYI